MACTIHNIAFSIVSQIRVKHPALVDTTERTTCNHSYDGI